jgi:class 3 adenylate cyclase
MALISISLDLAGSTKAKNRMAELCEHQDDRMQSLYSELMQRFYGIEARFYFDLLSLGVTIDQLFFVKSIGDEIWAVIDIGEPQPPTLELNNLAIKTLRAALETAQRKVFMFAASTADPLSSAPEEPHGERFCLGVKVFVDLLHSATETSEIRHRVFHGQVSRLARAPDPPRFGQSLSLPDVATVLTRLAGVAVTPTGERQLAIARRTDYIGPDVDLFFRCTKAAEPGKLVFGNSLALALQDQEGRALLNRNEDDADAGAQATVSVPTGDSWSSLRIVTLETTGRWLSEDDLKGFSSGYLVHKLDSINPPWA